MKGVIKGDWGLGWFVLLRAGRGIEALWAVEDDSTVGSGDANPIDDDEVALGRSRCLLLDSDRAD